MSNTKIEWTDATWNIVTGCTKVRRDERHPMLRLGHYDGSVVSATVSVPAEGRQCSGFIETNELWG